jgi:protein gp37
MSAIRKRFKQVGREPHFVEKELIDLGRGKTIFVGSSTDMWGKFIPDEWILAVLNHVKKYPDNTYLFQTKNPARYFEFVHNLPKGCHLGTTIETNREYGYMGNTSSPKNRAAEIGFVGKSIIKKTFITVEPIIDFDLYALTELLNEANPHYINIGADSGNNHLPEPPREKIIELIDGLISEVRLKANLRRLLPEHDLYGGGSGGF